MSKKDVQDKTTKKLWEDCFKAILKQDWKNALSQLGQLEAMEPDNPQVHLKIGDILQRKDDIHGALSSYHHAALCLINQGFKQKAIAIYKVILRIEPNDTEALNMSRNILEEIKEEKTASHFPEKKSSMDSKDADTIEEESSVIFSAEDVSLPDEPLLAKASEKESKTKSAKPDSGEKAPWIFDSLSGEEFKELKKNAILRSFKDGESVVNEGDMGDSMFTIISGQAEVTTTIQDRTFRLATLSEGDFFGEVAFLTGRPRTANVVALGDIQVMDIDRKILQKVIKKHPQVMDSLVEFYYSRVKDTLLKVKSRTSK